MPSAPSMCRARRYHRRYIRGGAVLELGRTEISPPLGQIFPRPRVSADPGRSSRPGQPRKTAASRPRKGKFPRETGLHRTLRWRETDSNHRFLSISRGSYRGKILRLLRIPGGRLSHSLTQRDVRFRAFRKRGAWLGSFVSLWAKPHPWRRAAARRFFCVPA